jgi:hypothetical protein
MAKLRVLLDENLGPELKKAFGRKITVHTISDLGISGAGDPEVIEEAVHRKCLIVTADKKFVDTYRNHEWRKGRDGRFFYGLVFLTESATTGQLRQLKLAVQKIRPEHDDLISFSSGNSVTVEKLDDRAV